jgi:hypothetical protein
LLTFPGLTWTLCRLRLLRSWDWRCVSPHPAHVVNFFFGNMTNRRIGESSELRTVQGEGVVKESPRVSFFLFVCFPPVCLYRRNSSVLFIVLPLKRNPYKNLLIGEEVKKSYRGGFREWSTVYSQVKYLAKPCEQWAYT